MQAVFWYVRWARGDASRFPVRAVASRWCKLFSGTCGGPAVVTSCFPTSWGHLGASWGAFRASWSGFLIIFGIPTPSEAQFEPPGAIWAPLGASWGLPGAPPGAVWADPGPPGTSGGLPGTPLGASWGLLGASWGLPPPPGEPQTRQKAQNSREITKSVGPTVFFIEKCFKFLGLAEKSALKTQPNRTKTLFSKLEPRILRGFWHIFSIIFQALPSAKPRVLRGSSSCKAQKTLEN